DEQITHRKAELQHLDRLRSQYGSHSNDTQPANRLPFSTTTGNGQTKSYGADGSFAVGGFEPAGSSTLAYDPQKKHWAMVQEAGAGLLNDKKNACWELLGTFDYKRDFALYLRKGMRAVDMCHKTLQEGLDDQGG